MSSVPPNTEECPQCQDLLRFSRKYLKAFEDHRITFDEFAYNLVLQLVSICDCGRRQFIALLPTSLVSRLNDYLDEFLVSVDYMPCPKPFLVVTTDEEAIEQKKRELRPK